MAITKIQSESLNLADDYAFTGTITGAGGITEADQWRLTGAIDFVQDTATLISTSFERVDTGGFNYIGTGMTQSSGIFSFPSTGIWLIEFNGMTQGGGSDYIVGQIKTTTNNSTYSTASQAITFSTASSRYGNFNCKFIFDVTDISTHKVAFYQYKQDTATIYLNGSTSRNDTHFTFIRLGDT